MIIEDDSRVISLDGIVPEIIYALRAGDRLVATDASGTYPEEAMELPQVGYVRQLSAEPVLALAPTLILSSDDAGPPEAIEQLKESGVAVAMFHSADSLEDSYALIRSIMLKDGEVRYCGMPEQMLRAETIQPVFETPVLVLSHPQLEIPLVTPQAAPAPVAMGWRAFHPC